MEKYVQLISSHIIDLFLAVAHSENPLLQEINFFCGAVLMRCMEEKILPVFFKIVGCKLYSTRFNLLLESS